MRVKSSQTQTVSTGEGHGTWPQPLLSQESPSGTRACTHRYEGEPGRLRTLARGRQDTVREGVSGGGQLMWRANQGGPLGLLERGVRTCDHGLLLEATLALEPAVTRVTLLQQECFSCLCRDLRSLFKHYLFICLLVLLFDRVSRRSG